MIGKMLTYETIPCWYELSFKGRNGRPGLLLRIHDDFVKQTKGIPKEVPGVVNFMTKGFGFKRFSGRFGSDLGFEESLKYLGTKDGFLEYEIPTPLVKKFKDKRCEHCDGNGYAIGVGHGCLLCEGGRVSYYDWKEAHAISASLSLLFSFLSLIENETTAEIPQLMTIFVITVKELHGGSLGGEYGCELVEYLRSRPPGRIPEMIAAMWTVCERMEGKIPRYYQHSFEAYAQGSNGWLNVGCPGDATGLHPADCQVDGTGGYHSAVTMSTKWYSSLCFLRHSRPCTIWHACII